MIDEIQNRDGPVSFLDHLMEEIPQMDFGKEATAEEIKEVLGEESEEEDDEEEEENDKKDTEEEKKNDNNKEEENKSDSKEEEKKSDDKKEEKKSDDKKEEKKSDDKKKEKKSDDKKEEKKLDVITEEEENDKEENSKVEENKKTVEQTTQAESKPNETTNNEPTEASGEKKKKRKRKKKLPSISEEKSETPSEDIFVPVPEKLYIAVIGYEKSGKSSFVKKYTKNLYDRVYIKTEEVLENKDRLFLYKDKNIQLVIIDTPPIPKHGTCQIVQEQISRAHIIIYVCDITEDDSLFKIKLNFTNFDFKPKSVIVIIGNCIDKISKFSGINKKNLIEYCKENKLLLNFVSCAKNTATDIENIVEKKIIPRYFELYDKTIDTSLPNQNTQSNI